MISFGSKSYILLNKFKKFSLSFCLYKKPLSFSPINSFLPDGQSLQRIGIPIYAYIGIPILCSDCPSGRKEFIGENERGFLYRQNDSENFLNLFNKMYDLDPNEIKKIILRAKKQTKKFTPFKSFLKLNKVLN